MAGEVTLDRAIALLSSDKQRDRSDGLADLKHILDQNKRNSKLLALNDKACHKIFESLFRFVSVEKALYNRANSKGPAASRLSTCASVFRTAASVFLHNLRAKSLRAIVDHITDILIIPRDGLFELLSVDYTKCLSTILHYPPHAEHLGVEEWEKVIKFCLRVIHAQDDEEGQTSARNGRPATLDSYLGASSTRSTPSRTTPTLTFREKPKDHTRAIGDALTCIQILSGIPNAPIQKNAESMFYGLKIFVGSSPIAGSGYQSAFKAINTIAMKIFFDDSQLVQTSLLDLVPIIRLLWTTKLIGLKDELLVTIMLTVIVLTDGARRSPSALLASSIEELVDTLHSEYIKRSEKDMLQVDELDFHPKSSTKRENVPIWPRLESNRSEHNWTIVWAIASLLGLSEEVAVRSSSAAVTGEASSKRQRFTSMIEDVFRDSTKSSGNKRVCALQLIPFLHQRSVTIESKMALLEQLMPNILDDNSTVSCWTMIAISSIASGTDAKLPPLRSCWQQIWDLTSRASTSQFTSRPACSLMNILLQCDLLDYSTVLDTANSMISSVTLNGPSTLSDSSLAFWAKLIRMTVQTNPGSVSHASNQICAWLRDTWTIGTVADRIQTAQVAAFARPLDLINLLLACTNRQFCTPEYMFKGPTGPVAFGWHFYYRNKQLLTYLFDLQGMPDLIDVWGGAEEQTVFEKFTRLDPNDTVVLDLLQTKSEMFLLTWQSLSEDKSHHITPDIVQIIASFCITVTLYVSSLPQQPSSRPPTLQHNTQSLWQNVCSFLGSHEPIFAQTCLYLFSPFLHPELLLSVTGAATHKPIFELLPPFTKVLESFRQGQRGNSFNEEEEPAMDLDDPFLSPPDKLGETASIVALNRCTSPEFKDSETFQRYMTILMSVCHIMNASSCSSHDQKLDKYLTNLNEVDILAAHKLLPQVYRACAQMERASLLMILEDLGEKCLQSYELERCENSQLVCIQMLSSFVESWTKGEQDHLNESASDIYTWFTEVLLMKGRASSSVQIAFAELLRDVIKSNPTYSNDQSCPSPRTTLFLIIREGDILVKFNGGNLIPELFAQFPLKDHDIIFNDVLDSLPRDPDWGEGIALRLFLLAQLASRWHTLLRRSIYHMFETPAQVPHSLWYAEKCLHYVSETLGLEDAKELFRLFSSQILYTWTETQSITSMPFSIFEYATLGDMLSDAQDEIVGQIMMRASEEDASELSNFMNKPFVELLTTSFYKAEAYTIARDITTPPGQGSQPKGVENRLKKILGADKFVNLIDKQFPQIIAIFFGSLDLYEQVEKAFTKREEFRDALSAYKNIIGKSTSKIVLPPNQQPSFRARVLLDELEFLCRRGGYELETIWTPTLASYVCRTLLESIHPALGSLHACSVIRKIRILVCVAGPVMLRDYPFEMTIHALQPHLVDLYCSEDALGIFWYLLEAGTSYLIENPGLMGGIAVSTLLSLRKFIASPPRNATQGNQLKVVLEKLQSFLQWFEEYLSAYESPALSLESFELFQRLVRSSKGISTSSKNSANTNERDLLLQVMADRNSRDSLLSKPISDHVISLLCVESNENFNYRQNVIEKDDDAISNTVSVFQSLQNFTTGRDYRLWAARVIGRAFAATGKINDVLLREQDPVLFQIKPQESSSVNDFDFSKASILQMLCGMLQSDRQVGYIERTLQLIVSNLERSSEFGHCGGYIPSSIMKALTWSPYHCPGISLNASEMKKRQRVSGWDLALSPDHWARNIALLLSEAAQKDPVIGPLSTIIYLIPDLAFQILPYMLHDVLLAELQGKLNISRTISDIFKQALREVDDNTIPHVRLVISCILYLRNQPIPRENTIVERDEWLDLDFAEASKAASRCQLPKTALLFLEIHASRNSSGSRRSSLFRYETSPDTLHDIFKSIDDPDFFYGIQQTSSLDSVMEKLEHESSGFKNLLFQSAQYDSQIQMTGQGSFSGLLKALNSTNLQGIASALFAAPRNSKDSSFSSDSMLQSAMNLRQWDIPVSPFNTSPSSAVFRAFQSLNMSGSLIDVSKSIDESLLNSLNVLGSNRRSAVSLRAAMRVLGIMTEIDDVLNSKSSDEINQKWQEMVTRNSWLNTTSVHEVGEILNCHEALFSSIKERDYLKLAINMSDDDAQLLEVKAIRQSLRIARNQGIAQASLKLAVCLSKLSNQSASLGLNIEGVAKFDLANVLWDQGEMTASIQMLQQLREQNDLHKQAVPMSRAELLVTLGHHVAEARLEKPEAIIQNYLNQAVKELKNRSEADEAGRVYHGFAMFCDQQLQNPDGLEDFTRIEHLRNRKEKEVLALDEMLKAAEGKDRDNLKYHRTKTKQWFDLDDREYQRLKRSREAFLQQCLENYLICLKESECYNNDALRFCALWLDESSSEIANKAVSKYLNQVPSRKFAPLINQLTSRLLDVPDEFQEMLSALIFRICVEHPFHGMYQIFASSKSKGGKDQSALSRNRAAGKIVEGLKNDKRIGPTWVAVHNTNINYVRFAVDRLDDKMKSGAKVPLKKLPTGGRLEQDAATQRLPPPTMKIDIRVDCNYKDVPKLVRYYPEFAVASGVSAPKIVTAVASNGVRYKQLFKGGNDDLRQDAIMEQVFEQVSSLLKDHQATRQRNLGIRTYKVLPLTSNAGIIEFVPNTIPLHDYLMPAHQKYYPKDMKPNVCRKHISDVQGRSFEQRVRTFRQVTEHFHPVMRYFFLEKFNNPDDWFAKRLSYTQSTAAISILGHVLGLGDRHGHNILLDERTGEVVHIDLGVAFEQGRVLPVPEVVPFRLTRDLVDGMGITKTEGVFRRCCEFTLEALRQESYSIMTILDVLRYDPLYSWTVSPLRMRRMQDAQAAGDDPPMLAGANDQRPTNEPSEADRALTVVTKKLSKTLSVTATVNELIQQATDDRNLAVLYCGWAAYA